MTPAPNLTRILDLIVCPHCRGPLSVAGDVNTNCAALHCASCLRRYSIQDGIPVLITERAAT